MASTNDEPEVIVVDKPKTPKPQYKTLLIEDFEFWVNYESGEAEEMMSGIRQEAIEHRAEYRQKWAELMAIRCVKVRSVVEMNEFIVKAKKELEQTLVSQFELNGRFNMYEIGKLTSTKCLHFMSFLSPRDFIRTVIKIVYDPTMWDHEILYEKLLGRIIASFVLVDEGIRFFVYKPKLGVWTVTDDKEVLTAVIGKVLFWFKSMVKRYLVYKKKCRKNALEFRNNYKKGSLPDTITKEIEKRDIIIGGIEKFVTRFLFNERLPLRLARLLMEISLEDNPHELALDRLKKSHLRPTINFEDYTVNLETLEASERSNVSFTMGCCNAKWEWAEGFSTEIPSDQVYETMKKEYKKVMKFLWDFAAQDMARLETIVMLLYLAIRPCNYHKLMGVIYGPGNSAKTTLLHLLSNALNGVDDYYAQQLPEGVLTNVPQSASSHDGKQARFHEGIRFFWYNETSRNTPFNSKKVKEFADGTYETLIRACGSKRIKKLKFSPFVIIAANGESLPYIPGAEKDDAIYNRMVGFETLCRYVDKATKDAELKRLESAITEEGDADIKAELTEQKRNVENRWLLKSECQQRLIMSKGADLLHVLVLYGGALYREKRMTEKLFDDDIVKSQKFIDKLTTSDHKAGVVSDASEWLMNTYELVLVNGKADRSIELTPGVIGKAFKDYGGKFSGNSEDFCRSLLYDGKKLCVVNKAGKVRVYGLRERKSPPSSGAASSSGAARFHTGPHPAEAT